MTDPATLGELISMAVWWGIIFSAIPLMAGMAVGLCISIVQAATQIQEQSLTFVPKLCVVALVLGLTGEWMWERLLVLTQEALELERSNRSLSPRVEWQDAGD